MTEVNDTELARICDTATTPSEKRRLILDHFRRANNGNVLSILQQLNEDASQGLTSDQEAKAVEELGRTGISGLVGRKICNLFAHESAANLDDPSEIRLRKPGIKILGNEAAAEEGSEISAGLNVDGTTNTVNPFASFANAKSEFASEEDTPGAPKTTKAPVFTIS